MRGLLKSASFVVLFSFAALLVAPRWANATNYSNTTTPALVNNIRVTKSPTGALAGQPTYYSYFTLAGVSVGPNWPNCAGTAGLVVFKFTDADKNLLATLQAALLAGKTVVVWVDDAVKLDGYCRAQDVIIQ